MATMKQRRATHAEWVETDPVLAAGELGVELDMNGTPFSFRIGDGLRPWTMLKSFMDSEAAAAASLTPYPSRPGYFLIPTGSPVTEDPTRPGVFLIG